MRQTRTEACIFVMFGATGDLMRRKLLPALFHLARGKRLPRNFQALGVARQLGLTDTAYRAWAFKSLVESGVADKAAARRWSDDCLHYHGMGESGAQDFHALAARIAGIERARRIPGNRILSLALPPAAVPGTLRALAQEGLHQGKGWTRLLIEKPFGHDLASAQKLNALVRRHFDESQVYRIDHYLGKETVQNLLAFRFGNALFESAWNRDHIKSVRITVAEALGVEHRAAYYDDAGAVRDMVQNHLTQLLSLTAMEVPAEFSADSIRFEKTKVLRSVAPIRGDAVVFGQYAASRNRQGKLRAYRDEPGVARTSQTETYVAMRLDIANWRWQGVPFYLRTGKRLPRRFTEIAIHFRRPPVALFSSIAGCEPCTNVLTITLQPDEGFDLSFEVKQPGDPFTLQTQRMEFRYAEAFGALSDGYETLLLDLMQGDQTLFVHADEVEASWRLYAPLLRRPHVLHRYPAGSWGPVAAGKLILADDETWTNA